MKSQPQFPAADPRPWEAAQRLAHLPGFVFFDSALPGPGAQSLIAAEPDLVIEGYTDADWRALGDALRSRTGQPGFAAGWVEYEGRFHFGFYPRILSFAHDSAAWAGEGSPPLAGAMLPGPPQLDHRPIPFLPRLNPADYEAMVRRAQEYIRAGDIYQVNLAHPFTASWSGSLGQALAFYGRLRAVSPAPWSAFLSAAGRFISSSSPELFLSMQGPRILSRPIKGTRPRAADPALDAAAGAELSASPKERAELIMITDLLRNDLGQVCEYGTVSAPSLLALEPYAQVHHLVSTITGRLRPDVDHPAALRACFPGGSITGAPKKRAREIIRELEPGPRGIYTGAIGYFRFNGCSAFNIAIRTAILEPDLSAHFHAGAGIVADSQPPLEWQETLWKAAGILRAAAGP